MFAVLVNTGQYNILIELNRNHYQQIECCKCLLILNLLQTYHKQYSFLLNDVVQNSALPSIVYDTHLLFEDVVLDGQIQLVVLTIFVAIRIIAASLTSTDTTFTASWGSTNQCLLIITSQLIQAVSLESPVNGLLNLLTLYLLQQICLQQKLISCSSNWINVQIVAIVSSLSCRFE